MRILQLLTIILLFLISCKKAPEYPAIPEIKFDKIQRFTVKNTNTQTLTDSIIIDIKFKDGDGDLGLSAQDVQSPYNAYDLVYDQNGNLIKIGSSDSLPFYNTCDYIIGDFIDQTTDKDTVLITQNSNSDNYFMEMWVSKSDSNYTQVDFMSLCPQPLNGRFPILNPGNYHGPLDGKLTFTITDQPWIEDLYRNHKVFFKLYIKDRALHQSNTIQTSPITLVY